MKIESRHFGDTHLGDSVIEYTITNPSGASVSILNLGGVIRSLIVPDKNGHLGNVVAGFDTVEGYEHCDAFLGALIGRSSGRIRGGSFTIDDITYTLATNNGNNNLHGGPNAFDKKIWSVSEVVEDHQAQLVLHYLSPDMEEGFPGTLDITVIYTFDDKNCLTIDYHGTTDKATYVNMTNHSYFNLSGDLSTKITNHILTLDCSQLLATDSHNLPTQLMDVTNTPFDFRTPKTVGKDIDVAHEQIQFGGGYDHPFKLDHSRPVQGRLEDPISGRVMEIETDAPACVIYSANFLHSEFIASGNIPLHPRAAICFETQNFPDAPNLDFVEDCILKPSDHYRSKTVFRFTC